MKRVAMAYMMDDGDLFRKILEDAEEMSTPEDYACIWENAAIRGLCESQFKWTRNDQTPENKAGDTPTQNSRKGEEAKSSTDVHQKKAKTEWWRVLWSMLCKPWTFVASLLWTGSDKYAGSGRGKTGKFARTVPSHRYRAVYPVAYRALAIISAGMALWFFVTYCLRSQWNSVDTATFIVATICALAYRTLPASWGGGFIDILCIATCLIFTVVGERYERNNEFTVKQLQEGLDIVTRKLRLGFIHMQFPDTGCPSKTPYEQIIRILIELKAVHNIPGSTIITGAFAVACALPLLYLACNQAPVSSTRWDRMLRFLAALVLASFVAALSYDGVMDFVRASSDVRVPRLDLATGMVNFTRMQLAWNFSGASPGSRNSGRTEREWADVDEASKMMSMNLFEMIIDRNAAGSNEHDSVKPPDDQKTYSNRDNERGSANQPDGSSAGSFNPFEAMSKGSFKSQAPGWILWCRHVTRTATFIMACLLVCTVVGAECKYSTFISHVNVGSVCMCIISFASICESFSLNDEAYKYMAIVQPVALCFATNAPDRIKPCIFGAMFCVLLLYIARAYMQNLFHVYMTLVLVFTTGSIVWAYGIRFGNRKLSKSVAHQQLYVSWCWNRVCAYAVISQTLPGLVQMGNDAAADPFVVSVAENLPFAWFAASLAQNMIIEGFEPMSLLMTMLDMVLFTGFAAELNAKQLMRIVDLLE